MGHSEESRKAMKALRRSLLKLSTISEENVDKVIVELFEESSPH
jgi:hypothetical protein